MSRQILEEVSPAAAEQGVVFIDGPDGISASLTPKAAAALGEALTEAAKTAQAQQQSGQHPKIVK